MKAGIYCRVSTKDQSTDLQVEKLTAYCSARGWESRVFTENKSGATLDRPELQKLLTAARKREFDVLVAWKLDRLFRSIKDFLNTVSELESLGVKLVVVQDQIDLTTPAGRLMVQMLMIIAEFERELIKDRVTTGVRRARELKGSWGPEKKGSVDKAKKLRENGLSVRKIAKELKVSASTVHKYLNHKLA